MTRLLSLIQ